MMQASEIEELFKANYGAMHRLAAMILHDAESAHDAVHDVFAHLLTSEPGAPVTPAYLMACVRNRCVSKLRNADAYERFRNLCPAREEDLDDEDWPDESTFEEIHKFAAYLPPKCGEVFRMRFYEGMKTSEISATLETTERSVYKHLHHALELLRKKLVNND